jgi:tRNA pseudouridine32 synthase/23S rRNA pseudouridine746 synthase
MDLEVLYADAALVVLNKPSGLLSVPGRGEDKQDCLSLRVQKRYPDALVVHRLDMATSGLLIMARGLAVQRQLNAAFSHRQVHKRYVAVVNGLVPREAGPDAGWHTIDLPIAVDWPKRPLRVIDAAHGKPSLTRLRCVAHDLAQQTSRLELEPVTGRSHQLRVHLQAIGHPILGDGLYAPDAVQKKSPRLLLHASHLTLQHPLDGRPLDLDCPAAF